MIDKLISSDFSVLAREHRRVPPIDVVLPREREKAVRTPWKLYRWIVPAVVGGFTVVTVRSQWFDHRPLSAPLIALAIASLLGMVRSAGVRESFTRQLGAIFAAIAVLGVATTLFLVDRSTFAVLQINTDVASALLGPDDPTSPLGVVVLSALAIGVGYLAARVVALWLAPRELQRWSSLAKVSIATVVLTWIGVCQFDYYGRWLVEFRSYRIPHFNSIRAQINSALYDVWWRNPYEGHLSQLQVQLLVVAAGGALLLASIALADRNRSRLASTWLAIVGHVVVAPVAVAFGMANLAYGTWLREFGGRNDGSYADALALAGVLVALTSMMLRRLRAVEAGNTTPAPRV